MKNSRRKESKAVPDKPNPNIKAADNLFVGFLKERWDVFAVLIAVSLLYSMLPLGTAIRFGGDEGYELMKGFLMSKGYKLYDQIWCDQTPLFPMILDGIFRHCGPSLFAARLMAASFGLLLFGTFFILVRNSAGRIAAFFATFLLISSPVILELSVSVMQEVPAFAVGLLSVLLVFRWRQSLRWQWLAASGMVMGIALGIKVTAALLAPAIVMEIVFAQKGNKFIPAKNNLLTVLLWSVSAGISLGIILLLWGPGSVQTTLQAQSAVISAEGMEGPNDYPFPFGLLLGHWECLGAAIVGLVLIFSARKWRECLFTTALLLTTFSVNLSHRPWWSYYYLHTAIPMAWLAGIALQRFISGPTRQNTQHFSFKSLPRLSFKAFACLLLTAIVLIRSERRLEGQFSNLRQRERMEESVLLAQIRKHAFETKWIYTQEGMEQYAFEARLTIPPQIAVVSLKRFWSGQISTESIVEICRQHNPEQILLRRDNMISDWMGFLADYETIYQNNNFNLYLKKDLRK
jgi:hypothetical protein